MMSNWSMRQDMIDWFDEQLELGYSYKDKSTFVTRHNIRTELSSCFGFKYDPNTGHLIVIKEVNNISPSLVELDEIVGVLAKEKTLDGNYLRGNRNRGTIDQ